VPARFRPFVAADGISERRPWECSLLYALRDEVRCGNLSIRHSKRYGRFDDFFIPKAEWQTHREDFFRKSGLPANPVEVGEFLTDRW